MLIGSVLVAALLAVSYGFEYAADYLSHQPAAAAVAIAAKIVAAVVLVLDAVALLFYLSITTYWFLRETWDHRKGEQ